MTSLQLVKYFIICHNMGAYSIDESPVQSAFDSAVLSNTLVRVTILTT